MCNLKNSKKLPNFTISKNRFSKFKIWKTIKIA